MIDTVWGSTDKPVSSKRLAEILSEEAGLEGTLYIGYPIIGTPEGSFPIDALLVSPTKGLVLFNVVEGKNLPDYSEVQDEGFNKMQAKLLQHQALIRKRKLLVDIHTITFAPAIAQFDDDTEHLLCNAENLVSAIDGLEDFDPAVFSTLVSVRLRSSNAVP